MKCRSSPVCLKCFVLTPSTSLFPLLPPFMDTCDRVAAQLDLLRHSAAKTLIWSPLIGCNLSRFPRDLSRSHYGNAGSSLCERCDPSCAECVGGREDGCRSCAPGLFYLEEEGRCLLSCPRGYYHPSDGGSCESCHASCRTCTGSAIGYLCYPTIGFNTISHTSTFLTS